MNWLLMNQSYTVYSYIYTLWIRTCMDIFFHVKNKSCPFSNIVHINEPSSDKTRHDSPSFCFRPLFLASYILKNLGNLSECISHKMV